MWIVLALVAAVFIWLGIDTISLGRYASPPTQVQKDEMMFGKARKPITIPKRAFSPTQLVEFLAYVTRAAS